MCRDDRERNRTRKRLLQGRLKRRSNVKPYSKKMLEFGDEGKLSETWKLGNIGKSMLKPFLHFHVCIVLYILRHNPFICLVRHAISHKST